MPLEPHGRSESANTGVQIGGARLREISRVARTTSTLPPRASGELPPETPFG